MTDNVLCPRCGKPMERSRPHLYMNEMVYQLEYICGYVCLSYKCGWSAPVGSGMTPQGALLDARAKAMKREEPEKEVSPND